MRTRHSLHIQQVVTSGLFSIDGEDFQVDNNIWLIGDDDEVLIVDAAHDAAPIAAAVGDRTVVGIFCTHGHNDHINAAVALSDACGGAPIWLHAADEMLWDAVFFDERPDAELTHGQVIALAGTDLRVLHTPGHSPGGVCLLLPGEIEQPGSATQPDRSPDRVFGGDTLFNGGPGATGRSFSDFPILVDSIQRELLVLDGTTIVYTGHGASTTIGTESPHLSEWIARGH